ncbi:MAG: YbjN domain-containing protein [Chitinophagaceae bacterium]
MEPAKPVSEFEANYFKVMEMVNCYAESVGLDRVKVYSADKKDWLWKKGSASIELFIQRLTFSDGYQRDFIKIFSPVMNMPQTTRLLEFYHRLLELNDEKLGIKLTMQKGSDQIWATFERDIKGIDYNELVTFIADFEHWADALDDMLKDEFPNLS